MIENTSVSITVLAFLLGLRHGIDWDHIAAITDITGTIIDKTRALILSLFYILGHGSVIVIFGLIAVLIGVRLPQWVDAVMEPIVGITLILLGVWLFYSILRHGKEFKMQSRWMIFFKLLNRCIDFVHKRFAHKHHVPHFHLPDNYGRKTAFVIGVIHGIGAETPTQVLLFVTAAGVGGSLAGSMLVLTFVTGLIISNTLISVLSLTGYAKAKKNSSVYILLGLITGIFSLIVGLLFLFGKSNFLPVILGG